MRSDAIKALNSGYMYVQIRSALHYIAVGVLNNAENMVGG